MGLRLRLAYLCLGAALLGPAVAMVPGAAHGFVLGPSVVLPVLSALAWLLSLQAAPAGPWLKRWQRVFWAWAAIGLCLGLLEAWPQLQPAWAFKRWTLVVLQETWLRACLGLAALALGSAALLWKPARLPRAAAGLGLAFFSWLCASGALSGRPDLAARSLVDWASYPLCFAAAWNLGAQHSLARRLVAVLLLAGVLNALYAWVQRLGLDPMPWNQAFGGRVMGFSGNPNYLGGYLALLLPLSLAVALDQRGKPPVRVLAWGTLLLLASAELLTQTRGAWAGAALGCALCLGLLARSSPGLLARQRPGLSLLAALSLLGLTFVLAQPQARERIVSVLQGRDEELSRRFFLMRGSARLALQHPVFGIGPGNFRIYFPSVQAAGVPAEALAQQPYVVSEHAHNDFLHLAAEAGWLAALLWAALMAWALRQMLRSPKPGAALARSGPDALLLAGTAGGLAALAVHGLANFPFLMLATQASAWAAAALALRPLWPGSESAEAALSAPQRAPLGPWPLALGLVLIAALAWHNGRRLAQDFFWWIGQGQLAQQQPLPASGQLLRAIGFDRREDRLWKLHGQAEREKEMVWNAIGSLREAVRLNPYDAEAGVRLGRALVDNHVNDEAEAVLGRVSLYAPNFVDVWEPLAAACYGQQKYSEAVKAYDWMIYFKVNPQAAYANKAAALGLLGQPLEALQVLREGERLFPDSGKIQLNIAITYLKMGQKALAREAWKKAAKLSPSDPQVDLMSGAVR